MLRRFVLRITLIAALWPALASAASRMVVVAVGSCREGDLLSFTRELDLELMSHSEQRWIPETRVRERAGYAESATVNELSVQLKVAQTSFYDGALGKAETQLAALLEKIARLPPSPDRVKLAADAHVLRAMSVRNMQRGPEGDEELRAVLRITPTFSLDPDSYAPQLRARVDKLRKELAHEPKAALQLSSEPSGAQVFIDGQPMGKTPLTLDLPPSTYPVQLKQNGRWTFAHTVVLQSGKPYALRIDSGFETSLDLQSLPCLEEPRPSELPLENAVKLGTLVDADAVVLVRLAEPASSARWLTASLVQTQTAQRMREGGIKIERQPADSKGALQELAHFIATGQAGRQVQRVELIPSAAPVASPVARNPNAWEKPTAITAAALAGGALAVGIALSFSSAATWSQFDAYYPSATQGPTPDQVSTVTALRRQAEWQRTWSYVAYGSAAIAAAASATLFVLDARSTPMDPNSVTVRPVVSPMYLGLAGAF